MVDIVEYEDVNKMIICNFVLVFVLNMFKVSVFVLIIFVLKNF